MISLENSQRISHQELYDWIKPHETSILARENFVFETAPLIIDHEFHLIRKLVSSILVQGAPLQGPPVPLMGQSQNGKTIV